MHFCQDEALAIAGFLAFIPYMFRRAGWYVCRIWLRVRLWVWLKINNWCNPQDNE